MLKPNDLFIISVKDNDEMLSVLGFFLCILWNHLGCGCNNCFMLQQMKRNRLCDQSAARQIFQTLWIPVRLQTASWIAIFKWMLSKLCGARNTMSRNLACHLPKCLCDPRTTYCQVSWQSHRSEDDKSDAHLTQEHGESKAEKSGAVCSKHREPQWVGGCCWCYSSVTIKTRY